MPLSINKLEEFLFSKGFEPVKYFLLDGLCFYIEVVSKNADVFLIYIPSKYEIEVNPKDVKGRVYKVRYVNLDTHENITDEYAGQPNDLDVEDAYGEAIELSPDKEKISDHLENNYKHPISIQKISREEATNLQALYRQMKRLTYCVQNLKYKLAVFYKNYICAIRRDDSISCLDIKNYSNTDCKKLVIVVDLETFYDKADKLSTDIQTVRDSIYKVLERNQGMHGRVLTKIIDNKKDIAVIPSQVELRRVKYDQMLVQLEEMLSVLNDTETKLLTDLNNLDQSQGDLQSDISRVHQKTKIERELEKVRGLQKEVCKNMVDVRNKRENAILSVDKIMFDNTVMFDTIVKNFGKLKEFC